MKDMTDRLAKLLTDAEDCALISKVATDPAKRELFAWLSTRFREMAAELEIAIKANVGSEEPTDKESR